jgi:hypothetical protein
MGDDSHVGFGKKFSGENRSVRRCVDVMHQTCPFVAKVRGAVFAHFHAVAFKRSQ